MPINSLQPRLAQVGVIRLGRQLMSKNNRPYPAKLETFRITSPSRPIVDRIAELFGGEVKPWDSGKGPQFEVITTVKEFAVLVPPQFVDPNYELWGNGYCSRRCDGVTERIRQAACLCTAEFGERFTKTAPAGKACKPTTRLSLMIADLLSLGTFKLESHGWNAAQELPTLVNAMRNASAPIPGRLEIQARDDKTFDPTKAQAEQVASRNYGVPVLHIDFVTPAQAYSNQLESAARKALGGSGTSDRPALESKPAPAPAAVNTVPAKSSADWIAEIKATTSAANLDALKGRMRTAGVGDKGVVDAWIVRAGELTPKAAEKSAPAGKPEPAATEVIDAVIVDAETPAMSGAQAWQAALQFAGTQGWNRSQLADRFMAQYNIDYRADAATDELLVEFLGLLTNGDLG